MRSLTLATQIGVSSNTCIRSISMCNYMLYVDSVEDLAKGISQNYSSPLRNSRNSKRKQLVAINKGTITH